MKTSKEIKQKPITRQKLWEMAKTIVEKLKNASETDTSNIDWKLCEELYFDWLEEELIEEE